MTDSIVASEKNIKKIIDNKFNQLHALVTANSKRIIEIEEKVIEAHTTAAVNKHELNVQGEKITQLEESNAQLVAEIKELRMEKDVEAIRYNTLRNRI